MVATHSPTLRVGIISAGAVGTAVGEALQRAGHSVVAAVARSELSRARLSARLPHAHTGDAASVARAAQLVVIAVPDPAIASVVADIEPEVGVGHIVLHTAGSCGRSVLKPLADRGAITIAAHPAMTFAGLDDDADRLTDCYWGITAADEVGATIAELLVGDMGGTAVAVPEQHRALYHAAMAHGSNHLGVIVADAVELLCRALDSGGAGDYTSDTRREQARHLLGSLLDASLHNALALGPRGLTGPVVRDDVATVVKHLGVISAEFPGAVQPYRASARRIAQLRGATEVLKHLSD